MRKKHMSPINIIKKGSVSNAPQKAAFPPPAAMDAARGGGSNTMNDYAKATPMANPTPSMDMGDDFGM